MKKKSADMPFGRVALVSQLLVQTPFEHDMNLRLEFSTVILWNMKSQNLNISLPSSFDPDLAPVFQRVDSTIQRIA